MINKITRSKLVSQSIVSGLLIAAVPVNAQQFEEAAAFQLNGFDFTPSVELGLHFDDNVARTPTEKINTWSRLVSPKFVAATSVGLSQLDLTYSLRDEHFFSSQNDNYTDHFITAGLDLALNARNRFNAKLEFEDGHEDRGTGYSIGSARDLSEPDQFKQTELDLLYAYGVFNADGMLEFNINIRDLDFDINSTAYKARDRLVSNLGGTFYYKIGATTSASFDVEYSEIDYSYAIDPANTLDSTNTSFLVGIKWEATELTSGFAKIGYQQKDFESQFREDFSGIDWSAGALWKPLINTSFEFITRTDTNESNGEGDFIRTRTHSLKWQHEWLQRLRTTALISVRNNQYEGQLTDNLSVRSDTDRAFAASVYYQFRRWLNFELGYRFNQRTSNRVGIDYDRNQIIVNTLITL